MFLFLYNLPVVLLPPPLFLFVFIWSLEQSRLFPFFSLTDPSCIPLSWIFCRYLRLSLAEIGDIILVCDNPGFHTPVPPLSYVCAYLVHHEYHLLFLLLNL